MRNCLVRNAKAALDCHHSSGLNPTVDEEYCVFSAGAAFDEAKNRGGSPGMAGRVAPGSTGLLDIACTGAFPVECNETSPYR